MKSNPASQTQNKKAVIFAGITVVIWSLAYVLTKIGLRYFDAFSLSVFRYLAGGAGMLILILIRREKLPALKDIPLFFLLGAFGFTLYVLTFNYGAESVTVATSSVIIAAAPVTTAIGAAIFFHEKMNHRQIAATIVECVGVIIVCTWDGVLQMNTGVIWIVLAMLCFTAYNLLARFLVNRYSSMQITEYSLLTASLTFLFFTPAAVRRTHSYPLPGILAVLAMGLICSGLAYILWAQAMKDADNTATVSNTLFAEPVITSLLGFLLLREIPTIGTLIGGVIILFGLILFSNPGRKKVLHKQS